MISLALVLALCVSGPLPQQSESNATPSGPASTETQASSPTRAEVLVRAKTVALYGQLGLVADTGIAFNPSADKAQKHLEKEMQKWGRFTIVSDPAAADLVIFLSEGNRAAGGGGVVNTAMLTVFKGGRLPQRGEVPLWRELESTNPYTFKSGTVKVIARFRKELEELSQRVAITGAPSKPTEAGNTVAAVAPETAAPTQGPVSPPSPTSTPSTPTPAAAPGTPENAAPSAASCANGNQSLEEEKPIPPRPAKYVAPLAVIARAKTFAVMGRGAMGEQGVLEHALAIGKYASVDSAMQDVVFQMRLWNRFTLEPVPDKADLVILVYQWDERTYSRQFHSVLSAIQVTEGGDAFRRHDPSLWASGTVHGTTKGLVSYLQEDLERFEKGSVSKSSAEPNKNFRHASDWLVSAEGKKDDSRSDLLFETVAEFRKSLRDDPGSAPAHAGLGRALLDLNFDTAAAYEFKQALALKPGSHDTLIDLGRAMGRIPDLTAALDAVHEAMRVDPGAVGDQIALAEILFSARDYAGSAKAYAEALQLRKSDPDLLFRMGRAQYEAKDLDAAAASLGQAIQLKADDVNSLYWLAATLDEKKQFDEAVPVLRRAVMFGMKSPWVHYELGRALRGQKNYEEAVSEFKKALADSPKAPTFHNELAHTLAGAGKPDEALTEFRQTVRLSPGSAHFRDDLGDALLAKTQVDDAIAEFNRAIGLDPKYAAAHFDLGRAREAKGDKACALVAYQAALSLEPENTEFKSKIESIAK